MVRAEIAGKEVVFKNGVWSSEDKSLISLLELYERSFDVTNDQYQPDREIAVVEHVIEILGGEITEHKPQTSKIVRKRVY